MHAETGFVNVHLIENMIFLNRVHLAATTLRLHIQHWRHTRCQFHQLFMRVFFVRKLVQSQNVIRKKAFVRKICEFNVDEIDHSSWTVQEISLKRKSLWQVIPQVSVDQFF